MDFRSIFSSVKENMDMYYCSLCNKKTPHYTDDKGFSTCTVCNRTNEEAISVANNESVNINEAHVQCTSCGKEMSTSDAKEANGNYYCFSCYKNAKNRGEISESKAKVDITSILEPLLDTINDMVTKNEDIGVIKKYIVDEINRHEIEVTDKKKMIWSISNINNNNSLQKYIYNSILKYKGLGTIKKTGESKIREYKENVKVAVLKNAEGKVTFVPYAIDKSDAEIKAEVGPSLFTISTLPQTSRPKYAMDFHKEVRDETLADIWNEIEKLGRRGVADNQEIATKVAAKLQLPVEEISAILAESKVVLPKHIIEQIKKLPYLMESQINKLLNKYNLNEEGPMLTPGGYSQGEPFGKDIKFIYDEKSWDDDRKILTFYKDKKPYAVFNAETKEVVEDSKEGIKVYKVETNESKINEDIFRYQITIPGLTDKGKFKRERRTVASNKAQAIVNVISRLIKLGRGELKYSGIELSNKNKELLISKAKEDPNIKIKKIADIKLGGSMAPVEDSDESKVNEVSSRYEVIIPGLNDKENMKDQRETTAVSETQAVANIISRLARSEKKLKYQGIEVSPQNIGLLVSKVKANVKKLTESKVNEKQVVLGKYPLYKGSFFGKSEYRSWVPTNKTINIIKQNAKEIGSGLDGGWLFTTKETTTLENENKPNTNIGYAILIKESKVNEEEGLAGNNATTFTPQVQEVIPPSVEVEEPKSEPEKEEIAIGGEKTYLGNNGNDEYFYLNIVGNKKGVVEELQVLDGNSDVIFTTKNSELDISDIKGFILVAIKEKDMANISTDIIDKYILPQEKPEETVAEEEVKTPSEEKPIKAEGETMSKVTPGVKPVESINKLMEKYGLDEKIKQGTAGDVVGAQLTLNIEVIRNLITLANKSLEKAIPEEKKEWELNIIELENSLKQLNKSLDEGTFKKGFGVKLSNINEDLYTLFTLFGGLKEDFKSDKDIKQWVTKYALNIINGKKIPVDSWVFNIASEILEFSEGRKEFGSFSSYKYLDSREGLITGYLVHYDNNFDFIAIDSVKVPKESLAHLKSEVERQSGKEVKAIVNIKTNEIIERNIIAWDEKLSQNKFYSMLEDIGKNSLKMLNENKTKLDIEKHFYKKYSLVPNKIWEYYKNSDTINKLLEKYKLNEDEEQKYVIYKKGKRIWKGHTTRDAAVSKAKELGADYCGIEHKGGDVETEYANLAKNENILNEDEETEIEQADDEVEMEKEGGDRFITKEELETPEDETDAEVPAEVTPVTEPASDISSPEGTPPIEDVGEPAEATDSETAKANIEMEYPDEPLKSTAIAFADSIVNDPKVYEPIRNLNWEGVYTNSEDVLKQADIVGDYGKFNKEVIKRLVGKLGDVAKYKLAREKGPVMYVTIRDGNVDPVSITGIKDLVDAREVIQTTNPGEILIKW